jgi:hypothetical protein
MIASEYIQLLRRRSYATRPALPDIDELAEDDLSEDVIACWGYIRQELRAYVVHDWSYHRGLTWAAHGDRPRHAHGPPTLLGIYRRLLERLDSGELSLSDGLGFRAYERARRDLLGLVGMRSGASREQLEPDEVFG